MRSNHPQQQPPLQPVKAARLLLLSVVSVLGQLLAPVPLTHAAEPGSSAAEIAGLENRPSLRPTKTATPPVIDGVLDDAVWQQAASIVNFRQTQPVLNADPSERTVAYFAYDADNVYVGIRAYDSYPAGVVATELRRDGEMDANDHVAVFFDTFSDGRNAFVFSMNAVGALVDGKVENNQWNAQWNGIWDGKGRLDAQGWVVEMVIPVKTLSFDPANDNWGLEIVRRIRRKNERIRWANISQNRNDTYVSAYGNLQGISGLRQGKGLEFVPTFAVQNRANHVIGDNNLSTVSGGDITYRITPSLTAQATINTDFSDAPVDQVQNNLGRFSLFFPETRDFFLSDADIFQFGGLNQENGMPFFSRRMGILNSGEAPQLNFGAKLTGRVGNLTVGMINSQVEGTATIDNQSLSVLRVSTGVLNESRIGMILTDGDPNSNNGSRLFGSDFQYRNSNLPGGNVLTGDVWLQQSDNPGINGDDMAYGMKVDYPNDKVQLTGSFREIQPDFAPKLGFANRTGIREYETQGRLRKRFDGKAPVRLIDWGFRLTRVDDMNGKLQTEERIMKIVEIQNQVNDRIETNYISVREVLDAPFQIARGVVLPPGDYEFVRNRIRFQTNNGRLLSGEYMFRWGDFWTGTVKEHMGYIELRPSPKFFAAINYQVLDAQLSQGNFDFTVTRFNVDFNLTPRLMWQNLVQHNSVNKRVGWNSRLRWEMQPGNILFLVLNKGWEIEDGSYLPQVTNFTAKVRWTLRF
jgi:Domain of unknown function (DUF5916)/Carbohydrate family 9 binding domain-like